MAKRSAAEQPGARKPRVLLTVLTGEDSLRRMCELSNGTIVTPGEVLPLLDTADVERVVFGSPSRVIEVRDRMCTHPSCEEPAERCEIDHIRAYDEGGLTVQTNGGCKCPFHHRWHHRRGQPPAA